MGQEEPMMSGGLGPWKKDYREHPFPWVDFRKQLAAIFCKSLFKNHSKAMILLRCSPIFTQFTIFLIESNRNSKC